MCHTGNRTSVHKENLHLQTKPLYSTSCYFDSPAFQACMTHYAHSLPDQPTSKWETMREHENLVAKYCREFLERIDPTLAPWGDLLGKWHDLGKYHPDFQAKIKGKRIQIEHAGAGARLAALGHPQRGLAAAFAIAGHHAGLANKEANLSEDFKVTRKSLSQRLEANQSHGVTQPVTRCALIRINFLLRLA